MTVAARIGVVEESDICERGTNQFRRRLPRRVGHALACPFLNMPIRTIPNTSTRYGLICFDANGRERQDDSGGLMSHGLLETAASEEITNIFLFSHGWKGDVPAAVDQYDRWIGA